MATSNFLKRFVNNIWITGIILLIWVVFSIYYLNLPEDTSLYFPGTEFRIGSRGTVILIFIFAIVTNVLINLFTGLLQKEKHKEDAPNPTDRPNIILDNATLDRAIDSGMFPIVQLWIKNTGQHPALNLKINGSIGFLSVAQKESAKKGVLPAFAISEFIDRAVLRVGEELIFSCPTESSEVYDNWKTSEVNVQTMRGECTFFVWGEILYDDSQGKGNSCSFCAFANNISSRQLTFCPAAKSS